MSADSDSDVRTEHIIPYLRRSTSTLKGATACAATATAVEGIFASYYLANSVLTGDFIYAPFGAALLLLILPNLLYITNSVYNNYKERRSMLEQALEQAEDE